MPRNRKTSKPYGAPWTLAAMMAETVATDTGCLIWRGTINRGGYGCVSVGYRSVRAHRLAYELARGEIPAGCDIDHLCRVRPCINPDHLDPVSRAENLRRSDLVRTTVNASKTHCKNGHEFSPDNTLVWRNQRFCKTCRREQGRTRTIRVGPGPWCGTLYGYQGHRCRCMACKAAASAYRRSRRAARKQVAQ